jgi:hypothetical protein
LGNVQVVTIVKREPPEPLKTRFEAAIQGANLAKEK